MSPEALEELARSIKRYGVIEPVIVRRAGEHYELVAGERRVMAARRAGLTTIPAIERDGSGEDMLALALIENIQRENLNPIEEALAYRRLQGEFGLTQEEIAERVGRTRVFVANTLRLLQLPDEIREDVSRGTLTAGHARAILAVESAEGRRELWRRIVDGKLTVRGAEALAREDKPEPPTPRPKRRRSRTPVSPEVRDLEERLRERLGAQVRVVQQGRGGRLEVSFYDLTDLQRLLEILGVADAP
jgi:ParB family chromosome partitioning protein